MAFPLAEDFLACSIWAITPILPFLVQWQEGNLPLPLLLIYLQIRNELTKLQGHRELNLHQSFQLDSLAGYFGTLWQPDSNTGWIKDCPVFCFLCVHKNAQWGGKQQSWQDAPSPSTSGQYMAAFTKAQDKQNGSQAPVNDSQTARAHEEHVSAHTQAQLIHPPAEHA